MQDFYDCGAGDSVWDIFQLGAGGGLLDWEDGGGFLREVTEIDRENFYREQGGK